MKFSTWLNGLTADASPATNDLVVTYDTSATASKKVTLANLITAILGALQNCRVYNSANISVSNGAFQTLTFDSERYDTDTMHSTSSNTGRITFTTAGKYSVTGNVTFASNATGRRILRILLNGATTIGRKEFIPSSSSGIDCVISTEYSFSAADYVELQAFQSIDGGGALNVTNNPNYSPEFMAHRIG